MATVPSVDYGSSTSTAHVSPFKGLPLDYLCIDASRDLYIDFWAFVLDLHPRQLRYVISVIGPRVRDVTHFVKGRGPADDTVCH